MGDGRYSTGRACASCSIWVASTMLEAVQVNGPYQLWRTLRQEASVPTAT